MVPHSNKLKSFKILKGTSKPARMAEWSKAVVLRSTIVMMRGFEPLFVQNGNYKNYKQDKDICEGFIQQIKLI